MKKVYIAGLLAAVVTIVAVYFLFLAGDDGASEDDPLAYNRRECGSADALKGGKLDHCVELALDLMGRADGVRIDDDVARALLKKLCDQAHERGCHFLAEYESTKLQFALRRCERGPDPQACKDSLVSP